MRLKTLVVKDLVIVRFESVQDLRDSSLRYLFYTKHSTLEKAIKAYEDNEDNLWGCFVDVKYFRKDLKNVTPKEERLQALLMKEDTIPKGRPLILTPHMDHRRVIRHELCHHLWRRCKAFGRAARAIVASFTGVESMRESIKRKAPYPDHDTIEELAAYLSCYGKDKHITFQRENKALIVKLRRLLDRYINKYYSELIPMLGKQFKAV